MRSRALLTSAFLLATFPLASFAVGFDKDLDDDDAPAAATAPPAPAPAPVVRSTPITPAIAPVSPEPYEEAGPRPISDYLTRGATPNFIRIDVKGHNIRTSPDFGKRDKNVDFQSAGGDVFAVQSVQKQQYGTAVQIRVDDDLRWVYVANSDQGDFQFCESDACFNAMSDSLDFLLKGSGVSLSAAQNCGVSAGPEGLILPKGAAVPTKEPDPVQPVIAKVPLPPKKPALPPPPPVKPAPPVTSVASQPSWEDPKYGSPNGKRYTAATLSAIDKYGQGLLKTKSLGDQKDFCPNYASLNDSQRKNFWLNMMSAISQPESSYREIYPPFDERTHNNVSRAPMDANAFRHYSMGLFALSYNYGQMSAYRPFCSGISQNADRGKQVLDPSLTIYSLKNETECAVGIMNYYVTHHAEIGYDRNPFKTKFSPAWSTVMSYNPSTNHSTIPLLKRSMPACFAGAKK